MKKPVLFALAAVVVLIGAGLFVVLPSLDDDGDDAGDLNALTQDRTFVAQTTFLSVEGGAPIPIKGGGGEPFADVVEVDAGGPFLAKHLGQRRIAPIAFTSAGVVPPALASWANELWSGQGGARSGAYHETDVNLVETVRRNYQEAHLAEVGLPGCDGASTAVANFAFAVQPSSVQEGKGGSALKTSTTKPKPALMGCRVALDGLDMTRVMKVDPFTVKTPIEEAVGEFREPTRSVQRTTLPPLVITVSETNSQSLKQWYTDMVINGMDAERSGTMSYMDGANAQAMVTIGLTNCGIFRLNKVVTSGDSVAQLKAHIYCEQMTLTTAAP